MEPVGAATERTTAATDAILALAGAAAVLIRLFHLVQLPGLVLLVAGLRRLLPLAPRQVI